MCLTSISSAARSRRPCGLALPSLQLQRSAAGELDDILKAKYAFVAQAYSDGSWRRLWSTKAVLEALFGLHAELYEAFTLQMLTANLAVSRRSSICNRGAVPAHTFQASVVTVLARSMSIPPVVV